MAAHGRIDDQQLLAYAAGELDSTERSVVEAVLASDPAAAATVARFRALVELRRADDAEAPPANVVERAKSIFQPQRLARPQTSWIGRMEQIVATLIFDSRSQPALAGYRGGGEGFQAAFEAGPAQIELEARPGDADGPDIPWRLMGQVSLEEPPAAPMAVALTRPGTAELVSETEVDQHGMFTMTAAPDRYDLLVRHGERAFVIHDLRLM